jgi:hypothetical protein
VCEERETRERKPLRILHAAARGWINPIIFAKAHSEPAGIVAISRRSACVQEREVLVSA